MMAFKVHGQVASLPGLVRALRALECRGFAAAFYHFVATHCALPAVALAAETAAELPLLFVGYTHVDGVEVMRLW